jgi:hypothetical protein
VKAAIHRAHGLLTASHHSIDSAAFRFIALERCCRQQLVIEATGRPPVPPERARYSREHVGSDDIGWLHFQPIYERLLQTEKDMFDSGDGERNLDQVSLSWSPYQSLVLTMTSVSSLSKR